MEFSDVTFYLAVVLLLLIAWLMYRQMTVLKRCNIPGPTPWPIVGNLITQFAKGFGQTHEIWDKQYGPIYGYYNGYRPTIVVRDLELVKRILVKDFTNFIDRPVPRSIPKLMRESLFFMEGRKWKKTRNILTPTFSAGKLRLFIPVISKCAETLANHVADKAGQMVEIKQFLNHFTMDVIASTAFGIDVDSQNHPDDPFVSNLEPIFNFTLGRRILMILSLSIPKFGDMVAAIGLHTWPKKSVDFYTQTGKMLIAEKRQGKSSDRMDFIKMLLEAEFDSDKQEMIHNGVSLDGNGLHKQVIERLTDDEINAQAFVFFLAGFETTASTLRFAAYILSIHPDIDEKLYDEMTELLGEDEPNYDNIGKLKYMDMFLDEVLRFYPPVNRLMRGVQEDYVYGDKLIPKGTAITIPAYIIQHDPNIYPDPEKFDPERFSPDNVNAASTFGPAYLPFGTGPRHCIGMRLALVETKIALVHLLRKVKFAKCAKTEIPLELTGMSILICKNPVHVQVQTR